MLMQHRTTQFGSTAYLERHRVTPKPSTSLQQGIRPCIHKTAGRISISWRSRASSNQETANTSDKPELPAQQSNDETPQDQLTQQSSVVEADRIIEESDIPRLQDLDLLPTIPDATTKRAITIYTALSAMLTLQAAALAGLAVYAPAAVLGGGANSATGFTLLGCCAASALQAAGLLLHLRTGAALGELGTWRLQRINAMVALYGTISVLAAMPAALASAPLLTGILMFCGVLSAAGCAIVARDCWPARPWLQWTVVPWDLAETLRNIGSHILRDISTLAGIVCLAWLTLAVHGASGVLLDISSWAPSPPPFHEWYPYATSQQTADVLHSLRRICGAGLLLNATIAHTMLEAAQHIYTLPLIPYIKNQLLRRLWGDSPLLRLIKPPTTRFTVLGLVGVAAASAMQAMFLLHGSNMGMDVNLDGPLMGPLYWTVMVAMLFATVCISQSDWESAKSFTRRVYDFFAGITSLVTQTLVLRMDWMRAHKL